jgi:hypothetical protein
MQALAQFMKVKDREAIEEAWESHRKIYQDVPVPPVDGIMMVKEFLGQTNPKVAKLTERDLIDMRFVNQLKK